MPRPSGRAPDAEGEFRTALRTARDTPPDEDPGTDHGAFGRLLSSMFI